MKASRLFRQNSVFHRLFSLRSEDGKGRTVMVVSAIFTGIVTNITGGVFYTGYLTEYGISMVDIGILTFLPFIAAGFSIFSPMILNRFPKRKAILAITRAASYLIRILGMILLPYITHTPVARYIGFAVIVFTAGLINSLFSAGYSVWHLNFLPESIRADYFNLSNIITNSTIGLVTLLSAALTDTLADPGQRVAIITALFIAGLFFAALDILVLCLPTEHPYPLSEGSPKLLGTVRLVLAQKKFMLTMAIIFGYTFASNLTASVINAFLLNEIEVSYTFITGINASYFIFFLMAGGLAKKLIMRVSWFKTFAYAVFPLFFSYVAYAFITPENYRWLMTAVRLSQHFLGVIITVAYSNFPYINMPRSDRTNYMSFHALLVNIASLLAMLLGTSLVKAMEETRITFFTHSLGSVQVLMLITGLLMAGLAVFVMQILHRVTPDPVEVD